MRIININWNKFCLAARKIAQKDIMNTIKKNPSVENRTNVIIIISKIIVTHLLLHKEEDKRRNRCREPEKEKWERTRTWFEWRIGRDRAETNAIRIIERRMHYPVIRSVESGELSEIRRSASSKQYLTNTGHEWVPDWLALENARRQQRLRWSKDLESFFGEHANKPRN